MGGLGGGGRGGVEFVCLFLVFAFIVVLFGFCLVGFVALFEGGGGG